MNVTDATDVIRLTQIAQSIRDIDHRILLHTVENRLAYEQERIKELRMYRNREQLVLEQMFYAKARDKTMMMVKGTNVDLYI